jgi:hypothetical protein
MSTTIRQSIITNLKTRMQTIRTANGYNTEAGMNVFEWLEYSTDATVRPAIIIRDPEDNVDQYGAHEKGRKLYVEIVVQTDGTDAVSDARSIIGDVEKAIGTDETFSGLCYMTEDAGNEMESKHEEDILATAKIKYNLYYKTGLWDPYTTINC